MDILSEILSSRIRASVFRLLFGFDEKELYMRELARRSGFSIGAVQSELKKLFSLELINKKKMGIEFISRPINSIRFIRIFVISFKRLMDLLK